MGLGQWICGGAGHYQVIELKVRMIQVVETLFNPKGMAIFWTFAEGFILIFLRGLFLNLKEQKKQNGFIVISCVLFILLTWVIMYGQKFIPLPTSNYGYQIMFWNFFCTLWVVLEGTSVFYAFQIYKHIKKINPAVWTAYILPLLVVGAFGFFIFYQSYAIFVCQKYHLYKDEFYNMQLFYVRICGVFWITFEWLAVVIWLRLFSLLKEDQSHAR